MSNLSYASAPSIIVSVLLYYDLLLCGIRMFQNAMYTKENNVKEGILSKAAAHQIERPDLAGKVVTYKETISGGEKRACTIYYLRYQIARDVSIPIGKDGIQPHLGISIISFLIKRLSQ